MLLMIPHISNANKMLQFHIKNNGTIKQIKRVVDTVTDEDGDKTQVFIEKKVEKTPEQFFALTGHLITEFTEATVDPWNPIGKMDDPIIQE